MVQVIEVFKIIKDGNLCEEASVELNSLLKGITNFNFVCMLTAWHNILTAIDRVNVIIQKQIISIGTKRTQCSISLNFFFIKYQFNLGFFYVIFFKIFLCITYNY